MKLNSKLLSIAGMISITILLAIMDLKDIFYKISMCGPRQTFSFLLQTPEVVTNFDLTKAIKDANGTWLSAVNQWNALALQCDALYPSQLPGKPAHLSSLGIGCILDGVKRPEEIMFVGAHRLDTFLWATGILADLVDEPLPVPPYTNGMYAAFFNLDERSYRRQLAAMIQLEDIPNIKANVKEIAATFATRTSLWEKALCYEMTPMVGPGEFKTQVEAIEHGCISTDMATGETVSFHLEPTTGKYYRFLSNMMGLQWHTMDYLTIGNNIFLRARLYMKTFYQLQHTSDGQRFFWHYNQSDLGVDGALYVLLMINEIVIVFINATDVGIVAMIVLRPLVNTTKSSSVYSTTDSTSTVANNTGDSKRDGESAKERAPATQKNSDKDSTLAKMLLYTDLTSVSYRKPLLSTLLAADALLAWLYVVPNSNAFAWGSSVWQVGSAYLSMFRVWVIVLIVIDNGWKLTVVLLNERLAAIITEFTYITSFEIMCSTLLGIYLTFDDIMNICVLKYGLVDGQRAFTPTTPTIFSFYNSYTTYSYGDRSDDRDALFYIYNPLAKIMSYGILFSFIIVCVRLIYTTVRKHVKGTLAGEVETFWRTYQRNSAEVFMDTPMRANALIRSQQIMSYRFGKSVFIRPFVYLEQNFYITRGKFRARPAIPFLMNEDAEVGADVDTKSYMLEGVFRSENSTKLQKKHRGHDVQIPLC
ncbi:hypothetical protein Poli38472_007317 [Pythium oligandrum]|uniref:Uncharacterized protein n=1 Tax=Pythium oligandrum TaxID=41045 RepID=A0A8K1CB45_PYTOL|nr:hypothetical protein Poli38472_007317 [Pythium oligandrum]|eukprot:TMW59172.1 hypothetical protein Poli38472_007317 [Pythium oligandrum]